MPAEALNREQIHDLLSRAGISRFRSERPAGFVLVFCGRWRETLDAYDRVGRPVGTAARREGRNKRVGYRYHYELDCEGPDTRIRCALRDVTGRQTGFHPSPQTFSVLDAGGAPVASIVGRGQSVPTIWGVPKPDEFEIVCAGVLAGRFLPAARPEARPEESPRSKGLRGRLSGQTWFLRDPAGRDLARITHLPRQRPDNAYVVEFDPSVTEPLRTIAPTFCVIADNHLVDRSWSPIGGA